MSDPSPYAPPQSALADAPTHGQLATTGQRLANTLLDQVALVVCNVVTGVLLGVLGFQPGRLEGMGIGLALFFVYFVVTESLWGQSFGKVVTGTTVVSEGGGPPRSGQVFGRTLARMIPFEALSFLGGKGRPVGWHDSLSGTRVIRTR